MNDNHDTRYRCRTGCSRTFDTEAQRTQHEASTSHDEAQYELTQEGEES